MCIRYIVLATIVVYQNILDQKYVFYVNPKIIKLMLISFKYSLVWSQMEANLM